MIDISRFFGSRLDNNMSFQKGNKINVGRKRSEEFKEKIRKNNARFWLGKKRSQKTKEKIRKTNKEKGLKPPSRKGIKHTEKTKQKMKDNSFLKGKFGKEHPTWLGGISFEPYGLEFNEDLKEVIRNRDRRKCQICKKTELENKVKLSIHHINYDKRNNDPKNLISLCLKCHSKTNNNREYWINYFKNNE
uniref:HNH nuclease domain-containing protein n=1 Tax=viral metagenome TaxID=1070528 RepID=A0A6M3IR95_9ZZZZ